MCFRLLHDAVCFVPLSCLILLVMMRRFTSSQVLTMVHIAVPCCMRASAVAIKVGISPHCAGLHIYCRLVVEEGSVTSHACTNARSDTKGSSN